MTDVKGLITGTIVKLLVKKGDFISKGDDIYIIESMKMQITIRSEADGNIKDITVNEGDNISEGDKVLSLE